MKTHRVKPEDKKRIKCQCPDDCGRQADICEHLEWDTGSKQGISFFYYSDECYGLKKDGFAKLRLGNFAFEYGYYFAKDKYLRVGLESDLHFIFDTSKRFRKEEKIVAYIKNTLRKEFSKTLAEIG